MTYKEYLNRVEIISEEDFNEVLATFPNKEIISSMVTFNYTCASKEELALDLISYFLENWSYAYVESCDFTTRTITIGDVESVKDLDEIKNFFSEWTINNYDELKYELEEEEKRLTEDEEWINLKNKLTNLIYTLSSDEIKEILNKYDK